MTTEVMPAIAPAKSLKGVVNSVSPTGIKNYRINIILMNTPHLLGVCLGTYSFVSCVGGKLTCAIGNNPYTIRSIPTHKPSPPFFPPHFPQRTPYTGIIRCPRSLNLEQNLHSFEGRDNCSGDCTRCSTCYKGCRGRGTM